MEDVIAEVLQAEKACSAEIESAERRCQERIAGRRQALERDLAAVKTRLQEAHTLQLKAEIDMCTKGCAAGLEEVRSGYQRLLQDEALCARIANRIIDIILEP
jgi:hypothetical protein